MPFGGLLTAGILGGGSLLGGLFGGGSAQTNNKTETALLQQELSQMQQMFPQFMSQLNQLQGFYSPYMQNGSPFLGQIQRAGAEQNAQQYNNMAGQFRQQMGQSGLGYGPSGTTAAGLGGMSAAAAQGGATNYLNNLLANENLKFQAAQGLNSVAGMMRPGQPATTQLGYTPSGLPGAIQGAGNALSGINWNQVFGGGSSTPTQQMGNVFSGVGPTTGGFGEGSGG